MNIKKIISKGGRQALSRAIECTGGQTALARALSEYCNKTIYQAHIYNWFNRDGKVPAEYAMPIEIVTKGDVKKYELRPDIYPPP